MKIFVSFTYRMLCCLILVLILIPNALSQNYKKGNGENRFRWDVIIHGPIIGLVIDL